MTVGSFVHGFVGKKYGVNTTPEEDAEAKNQTSCGDEVAMQEQIAVLKKNKSDLAEQLEATKKSLASQIDTKTALLQQLSAEEDTNKQYIADLTEKLDALTLQYNTLTSSFNALIDSKPTPALDWATLVPASTYNKLRAYYTKYSDANIFYTGRTLPNSKTEYDMRVENWCQYGTDSPELVAFVKYNNATVADVMKSKQVSFHKASDIAVLNIHHAINSIYNYDYDSATTGVSEFWKFALETYSSAKLAVGSDCEDWAFLNYVCCRIAGIPKEMLRVAAGYTFGKEGHCTNFYFASDDHWHHANSTSTLQDYSDATTLPLTGDSSESLNLAQVWFSTNEDMSWQSFTTGAQIESFNDNKDSHRLLRKLRFEPKR